MLGVENVEDVACVVDDMEATDRSPVFGGDEMREGGTRVHGANDGTVTVLVAGGARLWRPRGECTAFFGHLIQAYCNLGVMDFIVCTIRYSN